MIVVRYEDRRQVRFSVPGAVFAFRFPLRFCGTPQPEPRTPAPRTQNPEPLEFREMPAFETLDTGTPGSARQAHPRLGLKLEGSPRAYVRQLYKELERRGLRKFRPAATSPTSGAVPTCSRCSASRSTSPIRISAGSSARSTTSKTAARSCATCGTRRGTSSTTPTACMRVPTGSPRSARSIVHIAINTGLCRSAAITSATWKGGTRRSIRTKTSPKRSRCGLLREARGGAYKAGRRCAIRYVDRRQLF